MAPESKQAKRTLLDDSDSESNGGGAPVNAELKVNQEFARRFEHNKKREEQQKLEEKYKKGGPADKDDDEDSSSDEEEDEDGFLATEDLDAQISATLQAIRNKDPRVYDSKVAFYAPDDDAVGAATKEKKEKPVYLKDYQREKLLRGDVGASDDEDDSPKTYHQEQDALKKSILTEINAATAADEEDEEDDGFIKRKEPAKVDSNGVHPARSAAMKKITEVDIATADKDPENFLSNFMSARAWVPADGSNWKAFESDEGEDDDRAEEFEQAYNLRFEDPDKSNEVLRTYARDLAASKSVRREEKTGRKRQRELERQQKEEEKQKRRDEKARLRKLKLDETEKRLRKIKLAAGNVGKELTDEEWLKFLDDAWDDDKWEEEMKKRFGDDYYAQKDDIPVSDDDGDDEEDEGDVDGKKKKKKKMPKKPKWDDDIDIKDIIPEFEDKVEKPPISLSDLEDEDEEMKDVADEGEGEDEDGEEAKSSKKRKTADHKRERKEAQKKSRQERSKLEALVDTKLELTDHDILKKPNHAPFRYRETSPQAFGMTARDILLAPSDQVLNDFAGLKKFATFRDQEKKRRDRKTLGKKHRLRQWRRDVFGPEYERTGPTYGFERLLSAEDAAAAAAAEAGAGRGEKKSGKRKADDGDDNNSGNGDGNAEAGEGNVVGDVGGTRKKRKRSKGKKGAAATEA